MLIHALYVQLDLPRLSNACEREFQQSTARLTMQMLLKNSRGIARSALDLEQDLCPVNGLLTDPIEEANSSDSIAMLAKKTMQYTHSTWTMHMLTTAQIAVFLAQHRTHVIFKKPHIMGSNQSTWHGQSHRL